MSKIMYKSADFRDSVIENAKYVCNLDDIKMGEHELCCAQFSKIYPGTIYQKGNYELAILESQFDDETSIMAEVMMIMVDRDYISLFKNSDSFAANMYFRVIGSTDRSAVVHVYALTTID